MVANTVDTIFDLIIVTDDCWPWAGYYWRKRAA